MLFREDLALVGASALNHLFDLLLYQCPTNIFSFAFGVFEFSVNLFMTIATRHDFFVMSLVKVETEVEVDETSTLKPKP